METTQKKSFFNEMNNRLGDEMRRKKIRKIRKEMRESRRGNFNGEELGIFTFGNGRLLKKTGIRANDQEDPIYEDFVRRYKEEIHRKKLKKWREIKKERMEKSEMKRKAMEEEMFKYCSYILIDSDTESYIQEPVLNFASGKYIKKTGIFRGFKSICQQDPMFEDIIKRSKEDNHKKKLAALNKKRMAEEDFYNNNAIYILSDPESEKEEIYEQRREHKRIMEEVGAMVKYSSPESSEDSILDYSSSDIEEKNCSMNFQEKKSSNTVWTQTEWDEFVSYKESCEKKWEDLAKYMDKDYEKDLEKMAKKENEQERKHFYMDQESGEYNYRPILRDGTEKIIGKKIFGIEEELNYEYQLQESFIALDLQNEFFEKENIYLPNVCEFVKMSLTEKRKCILKLKKQNLDNELKRASDSHCENYEILLRNQDLIKSQEKNLIHYPYAYFTPIFESSIGFNQLNAEYFCERLLRIDENLDTPCFNLRSFFDIPNNIDMKDFKSVLASKNLENIILDDENLDVLKVVEILLMNRERSKGKTKNFFDIFGLNIY